MPHSSGPVILNYDDVLNEIGQLGKYSLMTYLPLLPSALLPGLMVMMYIFTGGIPNYRCQVPGCENVTETVFQPDWLNRTLPFDIKAKRCHRYNHTWDQPADCWNASVEIETNDLVTCDSWIYEKNNFKTTIVTDFDLACKEEWKQTLANTLYMVGMLFGSVILGSVSDTYGRNKSFSVIGFFLAVVTTAMAFSPNYLTFATLRLVNGFLGSGFGIVLYVWGIESVGPRYRIICGCIISLFFSLGNCLLGIVAYFVREWRSLQLIFSVPIFFFATYFWLLPESTRWLLSKRRYAQAQKQIIEAALINKKTISNQLMQPLVLQLIPPSPSSEGLFLASPDPVPSSSDDSLTIPTKLRSDNFIDVLRSPVLLKRIVIMLCAWFAAVLSHYGLTMSASNLLGDFHLNYQLSVMVEIPSRFMGMFSMNYFGRRATLSGFLLLGGIFSLITGLVPEEPIWLRILFSLLGKFCIACVFATVYPFTSELFSTTTRNSAVGFCSTCGRIGGIIAPALATSGRTINEAFPYIVFGVVNLFVGILVLWVPETKGTKLPSNNEEAIKLEKYTLSSSCRKHEEQDNS